MQNRKKNILLWGCVGGAIGAFPALAICDISNTIRFGHNQTNSYENENPMIWPIPTMTSVGAVIGGIAGYHLYKKDEMAAPATNVESKKGDPAPSRLELATIVEADEENAEEKKIESEKISPKHSPKLFQAASPSLEVSLQTQAMSPKRASI